MHEPMSTLTHGGNLATAPVSDTPGLLTRSPDRQFSAESVGDIALTGNRTRMALASSWSTSGPTGPFEDGERFPRGDASNAQAGSFEDSSWAPSSCVDLPR
jgi:hypothetical protein